MNRAPIRWDSGRWDIGSKGNMGVDSIPTLYDANASGYSDSEYQSGIGYANQLYVRPMVEYAPGDPYPAGNMPSGNVWAPDVQAGYFYINNDEYYFFANKVTAVGTATSGRLELGLHDDKYPTMGAPIIVTLGESEFLPSEPFGRTYEPTPSGVDDRTPTKYRKRVDLTGRKEYTINASGRYDPYSYVLGNNSMEFVLGASGNSPTPSGWHWYIDLYPSGDSVTVEMEGGPSGYATIRDIDFNQLNTYEAYNKFLVLVPSGQLAPSGLEVNYASRYLPEATQRVQFIAAVTDQWGAPISGIPIAFTDDGGGTFDIASPMTIWDGTAHTYYTVPTATSAGVTITTSVNTITDTIWIPIGKV